MEQRGQRSDGDAAALPSNARAALAALLAVAMIATIPMAGCTSEEQETSGDGSDATETEAAEEEAEEDEGESFTSHGSTYGKSETVTATTGFDGELTAITVSEWIKNPEELETISDESTLQSIAAEDGDMTCTQDGTSLTWQADGNDVSYTGITDQELPFDIDYAFELDGAEVDPSDLQDVSGTLKITISYENLTSETVYVGGSSVAVQQPYMLASIVMFDTEHARNVTVEGGQTVETDGYAIAIGMGMPGLDSTLGIEDSVDLPDTVTITAEVAGFDLPSITTIASNQALSMLDDETMGELESTLDDAFSQLDSVTEALNQLSEGIAAIDEAIATIDEGQAALNEAFPNATSGLSALQTAAEGISTALDASDEALVTSLEYQTDALEQLQSIDTSGMTEEQQAAIATAIADLSASQQYDAGAQQGVEGANEVAAQLGSGIEAVVEGLSQIQTGYEQLETAMGTVNEATTALATATDTMSSEVASALSEAQVELADELELVQAVTALAEDSGAWCGSTDDMPASTTFIVTAQAEDAVD